MCLDNVRLPNEIRQESQGQMRVNDLWQLKLPEALLAIEQGQQNLPMVVWGVNLIAANLPVTVWAQKVAWADWTG